MNEYPGSLTVFNLDQCDSTNNYIKNRLDPLKDQFPVLVTSGLQTGGRGRHQRKWISPGEGKGLYSSFGFSLATNKNLHLLPLIAGISVIEALGKVTGVDFHLKWPNDILYKEKKIAGILIENVISDTQLLCITGIGINLNHKADDFPGDLAHKAVSLKMVTGLDYGIEEMNPVLSVVFFHWLEKLKSGAQEEIIGKANGFSGHFRGKTISFHQPSGDGIVSGIFKGINHDGGLILGMEKGAPAVYYSGEII